MSERDDLALLVIRGQPTDEEVAAVVTVVAAQRAARERAAAESRSRRSGRGRRGGWSDRSSLLRDPVTPGPGAWRASSLPDY